MRQFLRRNIIFIFLIIFIFFTGCDNSKNNQNETVSIEVGTHTVQVEIADSPIERANGLAFRDTLAQDHGMLFIFPDESRKSFHMLGCKFDIDLAYIESNGIISEIITMEKEPINTPIDSLTSYVSQSATIKYALEMIGGWFEEHNVTAGTKVNLGQF